MPADQLNRRSCERFALPPMYCSISIQHGEGFSLRGLEGHVYDISEDGLRFELDDALRVGEYVTFDLTLPGSETPIRGSALVMWANSGDDDPGPRRMGARITSFRTVEDRLRLLDFFGQGTRRRAA